MTHDDLNLLQSHLTRITTDGDLPDRFRKRADTLLNYVPAAAVDMLHAIASLLAVATEQLVNDVEQYRASAKVATPCA